MLLRVYVTEAGDVVASRLEQSSGDSDLDDAAAQGAYDCRFSRGTMNGKPSRMSVLVAYDWTLRAKPELVAGSVHDAAGRRRHDEIVRELRSPKSAGVECPKPSPEFPVTALIDRTFTKAEVVVGARISAGSGQVLEVKVLRTSGYSEIDNAAVEAMKKVTCTIDPQRQSDVWATQTIAFRVKD